MRKKYLVNRRSVVPVLNRRDVLGFIGGATVASLMGCFRGESVASEPVFPGVPSNLSPLCVVKPEQTEGPYFVDERLERSDIRSDPSDGSVKAGALLQLVFQVSQISNGTYTPLSGAIVDVWHCDAEGMYSDVNDRRANTVGKTFLRGYQTTDADGMAKFITIYPGYYPGRAVHIHFKIRTDPTSEQSHEFTSQLYFDDALTDQVYEQSPYGVEGRRTLNTQDGIFQNGGELLMLQLAQTEDGYLGHFAIGLAWA